MRVDKAKNVAKVAKTLLIDPLQTQREIAENIGIGNGTVARAMKEVEQIGAKDDRIIGLTDEDFELIKTIVAIKKKRLLKDEEVNNSDIDKWDNTSTKRYSIFRGNATDKDGGLKQIDSIDIL